MNKNCPQCETPVFNELPGGLCPTCLMAAARQSQADLAGTTGLPNEFGAPPIEEVARLFPELEILQLIGRGGMGAVYKVRQKNLDRIVALKVFLYRPHDSEFAARFQREARALAKLNHPNIVTVHDFGIRQDTHFLIMEYVDGMNLRQLTAEERLPAEMALQMVPQLCDALQYAHDHGVIHRDIKPENLLLDARGKINIADFGLAKMTGNEGNGGQGSLTRTQQVMGTFNYMAPEQRERPTEVDHRADIYSLGVVIYEMLTGELPIGRFQPPSSKSSVNAGLDEVVMRALEKEPDRRYQQVSQFKTGFQSVGSFAPQPNPVPPVKSEIVPPNGTRCMITMMSGREKKGKWHPGDPQLAMTMMGGTELDLTNVQASHVNLILLTLMGGVDVIVPHGATVDLDGFILMGATVNNVAHGEGNSNMHVRIKSWGAMGGCEVRTPTQKELGIRNKVAQMPRKPREHQVTLGGGLVLMYKLFAMLVSIAIPIIFLLIPFSSIPSTDCIVMGIMAALFCGFLWSGLEYVRVLVDAGPEEEDEQAWIDYESATKAGSIIRLLGLMVAFGCPVLIIISAFQASTIASYVANWTDFGKQELMFAGIVCAIVSGLVFSAAEFLEEFFYGKKR